MSIDLSQFIPTFLEESFEGLEIMESSLLDLQPGDEESIHSIFRAAHSIKGGAGTFGFDNVTDFTHLVETLLDEMRDGRRTIGTTDVELLLKSVDCIRLLIEAARDGADYDEEKVSQTSELLEQSLKQSNSPGATAQGETAHDQKTSVIDDEDNIWQITFIPEHHLVQTGNDPLLMFDALSELGCLTILAQVNELPSLMEMDAQELYLSWQLTLFSTASEADIREVFEWVEDECQLDVLLLSGPEDELDQEQDAAGDTAAEIEPTDPKTSIATDNQEAESTRELAAPAQSEDSAPAAAKSKSEKTASNKQDAGSIRVGVDKVDSLINLVGELVITQSMLSELGTDFDMDKVERLKAGLEQLLNNTKELQESVMRIRMLPISFAFNRFPRLVHDLSNKTGKAIELVIKGEQTELDKTVMEQIGDPLVHLVRNAVDHGIESADVRLAAGKPAKGTIFLDAYHQGGNIVIEINDDGGGIDRKAVFDKAVQKGLADPGSTLSDAQVFDLLFEPGFSTAKQVSDISGRGVGMDVVKKNIQALGGRIQVDSTPGKGSTFKVHLPLTLAILDGQLVRVGTEVYIIPLIAIVESLQAKPERINRVSGDMLLYRLRDDNVPVLPIYQLFNLPADTKDVDNALLVVVEADGQKVGLMVDDLLAQQQVVVKSLKDNYLQVDGISGATILGDGSVAMILDIPGMINLAKKNSQKKQKMIQQKNLTHDGVTPGVNI
jgi:two-component system chemotaxis sensor kinase CheA